MRTEHVCRYFFYAVLSRSCIKLIFYHGYINVCNDESESTNILSCCSPILLERLYVSTDIGQWTESIIAIECHNTNENTEIISNVNNLNNASKSYQKFRRKEIYFISGKSIKSLWRNCGKQILSLKEYKEINNIINKREQWD